MRSDKKWIVWGLALALSALVACSEGFRSAGGDDVYSAPRNLGASLDADAGSSASLCDAGVLPNQDEKYCVPGHLEMLQKYLGHGAFVGIVDLDYDYRDVFDTRWNPTLNLAEIVPSDYQTIVSKQNGLTRVRVRRVIEEYRNVTGGPPEEFYYQGICNEKGLCRDNAGHYMPIWSGVNLVFVGALCGVDSMTWQLYQTYAVEGNKIYDYFGKSGDFEPIRKGLIAQYSQWDEPPKPHMDYCPPPPAPQPSPSETEDTPDFDMVPVPLPD